MRLSFITPLESRKNTNIRVEKVWLEAQKWVEKMLDDYEEITDAAEDLRGKCLSYISNAERLKEAGVLPDDVCKTLPAMRILFEALNEYVTSEYIRIYKE